MDFSRPDILWGLLAVPLLAVWIAYGVRRNREELARFVGAGMADTLAPGYSWRKNLLKGLLECTGVALLVVALAGPRFGTQLVKVDREGIDVVVALDTSLSMMAEDMLPNRLERAKQAIVDLIKGLKGDRVGLVVFAGDAYALCPLTVDYDAALMFTRTIDVDMVSEPGTALDKAIRTSAALFEESTRRDRAIILLTDGENQEGEPVVAAREAADKGIRIFTIGIGNPAGELIPQRGTSGDVEGYKKDQHGQTVLTRLDEKTLQEVAEAGNGKYLPATREGLELKVLYNEISGMEKKAIKGEFVERRIERFWIFLSAALALLLIDAAVTSRATGLRRRRRAFLHTGAAALALFVALATAPSVSHAGRSVDRGKVKAGNEYYRAAEYDKALTLYREAIGDTVRPPQHSQGVMYNEGNALYMQKQYKQAIEMYQRSFSPDSTLSGNMLYNRANALMNAGQPGEAVESYVQALHYLPDDPDVRHNLEIALKALREQQQQQQQQQRNKDQQGDQQNEDEQQQQGDQQQDSQDQQSQDQKDQKQSQQDKQEEGDQQQQQEQQADSTQTPEPQPADSTQVQPAQLSPEDMAKLSREDAMRILQALEEQEKKIQEERRKAAFRRLKRSGKDW